MSTEIANLPAPAVNTGLSIFDSGQFAQMWEVSGALSKSSLIPASLKGESDEQTQANCLRVVEQASRWNMSPLAIVDHASVVHGKLMWEGKLIAAAVTASLGVRLDYEYSGSGEKRKVVVSAELDGKTKSIDGTVADWKTTGNNSPWSKTANIDQMLAYRGARQWARRYAPEVILGVYAPDEMEPSPKQDPVTLRNVTPPQEEENAVNPFPEESKEKPSKTPAQGRQTKDRYHREGDFLEIRENHGNGKTYWNVTLVIGDQTPVMTTFSETIAAKLNTYEKGQKVSLTFTRGAKGYALEECEAVEGSLC